SSLVFRFEEFVKQSVNLQEAFARDVDTVAAVSQEPPFLKRGEWRGELFTRITAEFFCELLRAHAAELELQHELADVALVRRWRERAIYGKFAGVHRFNVGLELVVILVMHAVEMAETRDADGQDVRATEQTFPVNKFHLGRIADDGRAARDGVADFFELAIRVIHPRAFRFPV